MRIPRIYIPCELTPGVEAQLDSQASHYLNKVLRMEQGRSLIAFNGNGSEYPSTITSISKRNTTINVDSELKNNKESPLVTHLAVAVSRGDRMDWVLQKATELGVSEITPLFSERTEVRLKGDRLKKKQDHWQQILISSCEQCQRNTLPVLNQAIALESFLQQKQDGLKLVLHHRSTKSLHELPQPKRVTILIGPEGGLSDIEIEQATTQYHFESLTLGPRVLRTETAPIVMLTAAQIQWGDLG